MKNLLNRQGQNNLGLTRSIQTTASTVSLFLFIVSASACENNANPDVTEDVEGVDLSDELFDPDRLIDVAIEMDPSDWDRLRQEGRSLAKSLTNCNESGFDYTYFKSKVTVDGVPLDDVGVRKKGYLGSISVVRPSLKVNFGTFVDGQTHSSMKRMTLNNDRQDPSHTHQCMSYALFRQAGAIAPRCNFAQVTVNGDDLGIYSHVESIKKPFLERNFDDNKGNLYEIQRADFSEAAIEYFEIKTNKTDNDRSDLRAVIKALEADDENLYESLDKVIDVDAFLTYWAMEIIVGHWDGATGNSNNHYMYHDPTTDKFYYIPWGTDGAFETGHVFLDLAGVTIPSSVYALGLVANRLYNNLETRKRYHQRLRELLEDVWDEEALIAEVDRIEELTSADKTLVEEQREFIRQRRTSIEEELVGDGPDWPFPPSLYPSLQTRECHPATPISGKFKTTWGDLQDPTIDFTGNELNLSIDGQEVQMSGALSSAGPSFDPVGEIGKPTLWIIGMNAENDPPMYVVSISFNTAHLFEQGEVAFHGFETMGSVVESYSAEPGDYKMLGFVGDGKVVLNKAGTTVDDPVEGSFEGMFAKMY